VGKLSRQATEADEVERKALENWFHSVSEVPPEVMTDEIRSLVEQGEGFAEKFPDQQKRINEQVSGLKEISKIDLSKTANLSFPIGSFGDNFVPGAILWAILLIPIILVIHGISGTIQGFKERLPLAALLRLFIAILAGSFLVLVLWPDSIPQPNESRGSQSVAHRALWLTRNMIEGWADQPVQKINMPLETWEGLVIEKLQPGVEDLSTLLWHLEKPVFSKTNGQYTVLQPLVLKIVPVTLKFVFALPDKGQSWNNAELIGFQIGHLPLGKFIGSLALQPIAYAYESVRSSYGLDKGVQWMSGEVGALVVEIPSAQKKRPQAKETISAKELAEVYDQGFGGIYKDRYVTVEGDLVEVQSRKEIVGGDSLKREDPFDEFYMEGLPIDRNRRIPVRIRCQIKSEKTFFLDGKGDLFEGAPNPQNPRTDIPVLRKGTSGTKTRISAGRVESGESERRLINIYDCRKLEGYEAGQWKVLWEAPGAK
jgi:hypothetical protein